MHDTFAGKHDYIKILIKTFFNLLVAILILEDLSKTLQTLTSQNLTKHAMFLDFQISNQAMYLSAN